MKRGMEKEMITMVIAIVVLVVVVGFLGTKAYGGDNGFIRFFQNILPGFNDTRVDVDGPEIVRYDVLTDTLEFYDGREFVDFPTGEDVILNDKVLNSRDVKNAVNEWYFDTIRWSYKGIGDLSERHFYEVGVAGTISLFLTPEELSQRQPGLIAVIDEFAEEFVNPGCSEYDVKRGEIRANFITVNPYSLNGGLVLTADNALYHCAGSDGLEMYTSSSGGKYAEVIDYMASVRDSIFKGGEDHTTLDVPYSDRSSDNARTVTVDVEKRDGKFVMFLSEPVNKKISEPPPFNEEMPEAQKELLLDNYQIVEYDQEVSLIHYNGEDTRIFIKRRYNFDSNINQYFLRYNDNDNYNLGIPLDSEIVDGVFIISYVEGYSASVPESIKEHLVFLNGKNVDEISGAELL